MLRLVPSVSLASLAFAVGLAWPPAQPPQASPETVVTLYAAGDETAALSFDGSVEVIDGAIELGEAQLVYGAFQANHLSYGFAHDQVVGLVDLGNGRSASTERVRDRALRYSVSPFSTLRLERNHVVFLDGDGRERRVRGAERLLGALDAPQLTHIEPRLGSVYVLRYRDRRRSGIDRLIALQVLDVEPGVRLTLRWRAIEA